MKILLLTDYGKELIKYIVIWKHSYNYNDYFLIQIKTFVSIKNYNSDLLEIIKKISNIRYIDLLDILVHSNKIKKYMTNQNAIIKFL